MRNSDRGDLLKLLLAAVLGLGFIVLSSLANYTSVRDHIIAKEQRQLLTIAESIVQNLENAFEYRRNSIRQLRYNELFLAELARYLETGSPDFSSLENYQAIMQENVTRVTLVSPQGQILAAYPALGTVHPPETAEVSRAMLSRETVTGDVHRYADGLFISILEPVVLNGQVPVIISFELSLDSLYQQMVAPARVGTKGYASVKDMNGVLLMHPDTADLGREVIDARRSEFPQYDWSELEALVQQQKRGESGVGTYHSVWYQDEVQRRIRKVNAFAPAWISDRFWIVNVSADYVELTAFIQQKLYMMLVSSAGVILIFVATMLYIYKIKKDRERLAVEAGLSVRLNELNRELEGDIEQRKLLEVRLRQHIDKYERLFEGTSDAILVFDEDGPDSYRLEEMNAKACALLGRADGAIGEQEALNRFFLDWDRLLDTRHAAGDSGAAFGEFLLLAAQGRRVPAEVSLHRLWVHEGWKLILLCRDISVRKAQEATLKRSEERFRQIVSQVADQIVAGHAEGADGVPAGAPVGEVSLAQSLERINIQLEQLFRKEMDENRRKSALLLHQSRLAAMGEMIANIAHQWRQPLSGLGLIVENLKDAYDFGDLTEAYFAEQVDKTRRLIRQMNRTIDDFRDFFNPTSQEETFQISDSLKACVNFVDEQLRLNSIALEMALEEGLEAYGHQNRFSQVILSLLQNSIEAILESGGPERRIRLTSGRTEAFSYIRLSDTGGGIPRDVLERIFEPYFSTKGEQKGSGLGLYLAQTIIEKHFGGAIMADNAAEGAVFEVRLPSPQEVKHD